MDKPKIAAKNCLTFLLEPIEKKRTECIPAAAAALLLAKALLRKEEDGMYT